MAKVPRSRSLAPDVRDLFRTFVRIHILSFAAGGETYGLDIARRLAAFGYNVSPGTLYPTLHRLERRGLLVSRWVKNTGKRRRTYAITPRGMEFLYHMKPFLLELSRLVLEAPLPQESPAPSET